MKALILEAFNAFYKKAEVEKPVPVKNQVLVKIFASGVNPLDLKIITGNAAHAQTRLPAILGMDMAGVVESVGDECSSFKAGDEVYGMTGGIAGIPGSLAEYAAVDADLLALKPKNLSMREAAAIPLVFITAWEGLVNRANVTAGKTVLIHGGAGGVGHIAVQLAVAFGARVFSTIDAARFGRVIDYGAEPIDRSLSVEEYVSKYTDGNGFDIIVDTVGGKTLDASFSAAKQYTGHVISILGWGTHSLAPLSFRGATYSGVFALYPLISGKNRIDHGKILMKATRLIEQGKIIPMVDTMRYGMDTIKEAYDSLEKGLAVGKVTIDIANQQI